MQSLTSLLEARSALREKIQKYVDAEHLSAAEDAAFDSALAEFERLDKQITLVRQASKPKAVRSDFEDRGINVNVRSNPFDADRLAGLDPERRTAEVRSAALDAIERHTSDEHVTDTQRENATRLLERGGDVARDAAELVIQTGTPEYRKAFSAWVRDPSAIAPRLHLERVRDEIEARTAVSIAGTAGAVAMPYALDTTILLTNAGAVNPIREVCRVVQITGTNQWVSPTTAGISAAVIGESTTFSDNTPTYTSNPIQVYKQGAWAFGSFESMADADLAMELNREFLDAKLRLEAQLFTTGTGSSQPTGLVTFASNATSVYAGSSGAANSADIVAADIYGIRANLSPRWRANAVWFANLAVAHSIRQLGTSTNYHAFSLDLTQDSDQLRLLGKPFYEVSDMDSTIVSGSTDFALLHGDPSTFVVVDRVGMTMQHVPVLMSSAVNRPTGEEGFVAYWRSGSGGLAQDAWRLAKW